ncbi:hypothetical protein WAI453_012667 [Rhynchosporium graminicola]
MFMDCVMFATSEDGDPQMYLPYKSRSFSLKVHLSEQNRALDPLRTMDDIVFYQPPSASRSQPLRFPGTITASHLPPGPIASLPARETATLLSKKSHTSDRYSRNDKQEEFTASRNLPNRSDNNNNNNDFPSVKELLSDTWQKSMPASEELNGNNRNGSIDIDELLFGVQQKGRTSVDPGYGGMATDMDDNRTRGGSPTSSSRSTAESSRDRIILSDDEYVSAESETDYSNVEVDLTVKSDSSSPHVTESDMVNGEGFGFGTTYIPDHLIADYRDDSNDSDSGVADSARLQLAADLPRSASPGYRSVSHQASPVPVNTEITQGSASYDDLDVTKEAEEEGIDILADDEDDADTDSTKRSGSSALASDNPASSSHVSLSELRDGQHDSTQSPQPGPAAASHHQSYLTNDLSPKHRRRRDDTKNIRRKRLRMASLTGRPSSASPAYDAVETSDFEHTQPVALLAALVGEREIRNIDHEMVNDRATDDHNNEDYDDVSNAAASEIRRPPRSRKRVKQAKDMEQNNVDILSTRSLDVSYQAAVATSSVSMQGSEKIPIHGHLTLKTIDSKVVYCLTFSQDDLPEPSGTSQRQGIPRSVPTSRDRRDSKRLPVQERAISRPARNSRFSDDDDELLRQLKSEGLSWNEISDCFPERSKGTLQVHYSTKLKPHSETSKNTKRRRRSG